MVKPQHTAKPPVVFFVQGYTCGSIEWTSRAHPYRQLFEPIVQAGFALYRVEELAVGDSKGPVRCRAADWKTEFDAFVAAYEALYRRKDISIDRVFIFGHSMGGVVAPLLARTRSPRDIAVYGIVLRPWDQYLIDIVRTQPTLTKGADPVAAAALAATHYHELREYLLSDVDPNTLIEADKASADRWKQAWGFEGGAKLIGRAHGFWQGL